MNLLDWLRKALTVWHGAFSFLLCVIFSIILVSQDGAGRKVFHQVMIGTLLYPLQTLLSRFNGTVFAYRENERLRRENTMLRSENDFLMQTLRQAPRLEEMARFHSGVSLRLKAGQIIAQDPSRVQMIWVLDLGRSDSIDVNMPVITSRGIVGKVVKCFRHFSLVQLLSDPSFKVSVQVERSRARGIMESDGLNRLLARFPAGSDVRIGDSLVTAGLGGVFPKGLRVGLASKAVSTLEDQNRDVMHSFQVNSFQSLNSVEEAFVLIKKDEWNSKEEP